MSAGIAIEVRGTEQVRALLEKGKAVAPKALERIAIRLMGNIKEESPIDTGRLAGSWFVRKVNDTEYIVRSETNYARYVYEGRKPGSPPPYAPIERWAKRHNLPAHPVWLKIWKKGIEPNRFIDRAMEKIGADVDGELQSAAKEAGI